MHAEGALLRGSFAARRDISASCAAWSPAPFSPAPPASRLSSTLTPGIAPPDALLSPCVPPEPLGSALPPASPGCGGLQTKYTSVAQDLPKRTNRCLGREARPLFVPAITARLKAAPAKFVVTLAA